MFVLGPLNLICQVRSQGGWSGIGMAKFQIFEKSERRKKYSEINLKKGNPTFLPKYLPPDIHNIINPKPLELDS